MKSPIISTICQMGVTHIAQRAALTHRQIAGRLALFTSNWRVITKDPWVLNCIQGYTIDLTEQPTQFQSPQELRFPLHEMECLTKEVEKMLEKQAVSQVPREQAAKGFQSQLFLVPKKEGGMRPVINLKCLNSFVRPVHFKMEGIHLLKDTLKPGDWMTKVDLKDAYFMIPIASNHRRLLRFQWKGKTYQFNCLPFGLSSAPWVFTKTTRPVVAILRSIGLRVIIYIDDILIMADTPTMAREHTAGLIFLLENLGFIINYPKSLLTPTQELNFLGFLINSAGHANQDAWRKNQADTLGGKKTSGCKVPICTKPVPPARQTEPCSSGHSPSTTVLQEPANLPQGCSRNRESELLQPSTANSCSTGRIAMVATAPYELEWAVPSDTEPRFGDRDRCLKHRLGCPLSGCQNRRTLVKDRDTPTHKLSGATSSNASCQMLRQREEGHTHPSKDGQHNSSDIHKQVWGHSISRIKPADERAMAVVPRQEHYTAGYSSSRHPEHHCRRGISGDEGQIRLDALPRNLQQDQHNTRSTAGGPVCLQINPPTPKLCELETRPRSYGNRCLHPIRRYNLRSTRR